MIYAKMKMPSRVALLWDDDEEVMVFDGVSMLSVSPIVAIHDEDVERYRPIIEKVVSVEDYKVAMNKQARQMDDTREWANENLP